MVYYKPKRRWWPIVLVIMLALLAALAVAAYFFFRDVEDDQAKQASRVVIDPHAEQERLNEAAADKRTGGNEARRKDVTALTVAVKAYTNQNGGKFPTTYSNGQLSGGQASVPLKLGYYKKVAIAAGKQTAVEDDSLRLVTEANCANALSATVDTKLPGHQIFAIQYARTASDDTLDPQCQDT